MPSRRARGLALAAAALAVLAWALLFRSRPARGPQPVAWDRVACAWCRMLVGQPAFAAQLLPERGEALFFDDPGCLLSYQRAHRPRVREAWFHHLREQRWVEREGAAFLRAGPTPMGYGLGAVDRGTPGAISIDDAARAVDEVNRGRAP